MGDWLSADPLAHFVLKVIKSLSLSALTRQHGERGAAARHPAVHLRACEAILR